MAPALRLPLSQVLERTQRAPMAAQEQAQAQVQVQEVVEVAMEAGAEAGLVATRATPLALRAAFE